VGKGRNSGDQEEMMPEDQRRQTKSHTNGRFGYSRLRKREERDDGKFIIKTGD
jgi:hypothetical protein